MKLIFQMAEEIGRKSEEYVKRGALEGVDAIFGMHVWSAMDLGSASFESGERMACSDRFTIQIHGKLSHGSAPHQGRDAILAAAAVVMALQSIPSRINDPLDSLVVTVGMITAERRKIFWQTTWSWWVRCAPLTGNSERECLSESKSW